MKKMSVGVILGGLVFFVWGAVSWMFLPFHNKTLKPISEESLITDTLKVVIKDPGVYSFPYCSPKASKEEKTAAIEKMKAGPAGLIIFHPQGADPMSPKMFILGFLGALFASFVAMLVLAFTRDRVHGLGGRVLLMMTLGLMGWVMSDFMYWNWMGFPCDYVLANLLDWLVEFALVGLVLHKFVPTYE